MRDRINRKKQLIAGTVVALFTSITQAAVLTSNIEGIDGKPLGQVKFEDTPKGLMITPNLSGLSKGQHGFHIHQFPNCGDKGMKAGEHLDPQTTKSHEGPYGKGHTGDLPVLSVNDNGKSNTPMLAPRLKTEDLKDRAVIIHAGGDNYSNTPKAGGGGERIGCGKVTQ